MTEQGANSVGAGIIVRNDETFRVDNVIKDPLGRYIAIIGDHEEGRFLIASFYCPSQDIKIKDFISNEVSQIMSSLDQDGKLPEFIILGGDTNTVFF